MLKTTGGSMHRTDNVIAVLIETSKAKLPN
jgi:hypothetical protein